MEHPLLDLEARFGGRIPDAAQQTIHPHFSVMSNPRLNRLCSSRPSRRRRRAGFTLAEIMIVVAIIASLAALALPNFLRSRKRSQATRILQDLRVIDGAIDLYAIETNKMSGKSVFWSDIQRYIKKGSKLYHSGGYDSFGGAYADGLFKTDSIPTVSFGTFLQLSDVAPPEFWSPYRAP